MLDFNRFLGGVLRKGHAGAPTFEEARRDYASMVGAAVPPCGAERPRRAPSGEAGRAAGEDEGLGRAA